MASKKNAQDPSAPATPVALSIRRKVYPFPLYNAEKPEMFEIRCSNGEALAQHAIAEYQQKHSAQRFLDYLRKSTEVCRFCKQRFSVHAKEDAV